MKKPTLLVLAAGLGSRFGGLKQLTPVGPHGESLLDYSAYDAVRSGFGRLIFVIRRDFEEAFKRSIGGPLERWIEVDYAYQAIDDLPAGFVQPPGRTRPWGTAHAIRAARHLLDGPFATINADDFYGYPAFQVIAQHLRGATDSGPTDPNPLSLLAYPLERTLSPHGTVNRGICRVQRGQLLQVEEFTGIHRSPTEPESVVGRDPSGEIHRLLPGSPVSVNLWGFSPALLEPLEDYFTAFLKARGSDPTAECYLPAVVDHWIKSGQPCQVLTADSPWFGVTYPEDQALVTSRLQALVDTGVYPSPLRSVEPSPTTETPSARP